MCWKTTASHRRGRSKGARKVIDVDKVFRDARHRPAPGQSIAVMAGAGKKSGIPNGDPTSPPVKFLWEPPRERETCSWSNNTTEGRYHPIRSLILAEKNPGRLGPDQRKNDDYGITVRDGSTLSSRPRNSNGGLQRQYQKTAAGTFVRCCKLKTIRPARCFFGGRQSCGEKHRDDEGSWKSSTIKPVVRHPLAGPHRAVLNDGPARRRCIFRGRLRLSRSPGPAGKAFLEKG